MIVRVIYNEYGPSKSAPAKAMSAHLKAKFPDDNLILSVRSVPLAGNHDKLWVEVSYNPWSNNYEEAKELASRMEAAGIDARTYMDCD